MNSTLLNIIEIILAAILVTVLLLQARGSGSSLFGQAESTFRSRRGVERVLFRATIFIAAIFVIVAVVNVRFAES
jgi:preprotein translocase subunit SecG